MTHNSRVIGFPQKIFNSTSEHYSRILLEAQKEIAEKAAAQEGLEEESVSNKEKLQADNRQE